MSVCTKSSRPVIAKGRACSSISGELSTPATWPIHDKGGPAVKNGSSEIAGTAAEIDNGCHVLLHPGEKVEEGPGANAYVFQVLFCIPHVGSSARRIHQSAKR